MIGITELIKEVVRAASEKYGEELNYIFGNDEYIKEMLDTYSRGECVTKFPLVALFCPISETRGEIGIATSAKINLIIAVGTSKELSNEEREEESFKKILRPIYDCLLECMKEDRRFDFGYKPIIKHEYSENYSYGRYGAFTSSNEELSEPIDAIDIRNLEIKIRTLNTCRNDKN